MSTIYSFLTFAARPKIQQFTQLVLSYISRNPGVARSSINREFRATSNVATNELLSVVIRNLLVTEKISRVSGETSVLFWAVGAEDAPLPDVSEGLRTQALADCEHMAVRVQTKPKVEPTATVAPSWPSPPTAETKTEARAEAEADEESKDPDAPPPPTTVSVPKVDIVAVAESLTGFYRKVFDTMASYPPTTMWSSSSLLKCLPYPQPRVNTVGAALGRLWSFGLMKKYVDNEGGSYYRFVQGSSALTSLEEVPYTGSISQSLRGRSKQARKQFIQQSVDNELTDTIAEVSAKLSTAPVETTSEPYPTATQTVTPLAVFNSLQLLSLTRENGTCITFTEKESLAIKSLFR